MEQISLSISEIFGWSIGVSAIVAVAIGALWSIGFNRIKEGQRAEFQKQIETQKAEFSKELENLKAKNDKLNYISKTQFDAEFKMYQELSEYSFQMFLAVNSLFPIFDTLPKDEEGQKELFKERYDKALNSFVEFQNVLHKNAPFISKKLYELFENFRMENKFQINAYPNVKFEPNEDLRKECRILARENYERTPKLKEMHEQIIEKLREYLQTLRIMEDNNE